MVLTDGIDVEVKHGGHMDSTNRYIGGSSRVFQFHPRWFDRSAIESVARNLLQYDSVERVWYSKPGMPDVLHDISYYENVPGELLAAAELGRVVIYLEATMATEVGWDNEDGNVGDREGLDSDFFESDWDSSRHEGGNSVRRERRPRSRGFSEEAEHIIEASGSNQPYVATQESVYSPHVDMDVPDDPVELSLEEEDMTLDDDPVELSLEEEEMTLDDDPVELSLEEGMLFGDAFKMKAAVINYSISKRVDIKWNYSSETRMNAACLSPECRWRVYGAPTKDKQSFVIKKLVGPHSCDPVKQSNQATTEWIATEFLDRFRVNLEWDVQAELKERFDLDITKKKCLSMLCYYQYWNPFE
ncbi:hypothetical protein LINPERHAP2_LOCUS45327 [Linum perenne]